MDLLTSFKAFLDNPLKFISDPANTTLEYQTKKAVTAGMTKEEINTALTGQGFEKGSPILATIQFLSKNLPLILILAVGLILLSYLMPILRLKK